MRASRISSALLSVILVKHALAQNYTNASTSAVPSSTTIDGTAVANPSAFVTDLQLSVEGKSNTVIGIWKQISVDVL